MRTKQLVIAGMHRSGTSLITQWLHRCGLNVGNEMMVANVGNEQGYFEDMDFVIMHENLLRQLGLPDTGLTDKTIKDVPSLAKEKINLLLQIKNEQHTQWGWKDPRTCLFLNAYRESLPDAKYLIVYRDCNFCVYSLINRMLKDEKIEYFKSGKKNVALHWKLYKRKRVLQSFLKIHAEAFVRVWTHYNEELLRHIEMIGDNHCIVADYRFLLFNDKMLFDHLTNYWNFDLIYLPFHEVYNQKLMSRAASVERYVKDKNLLDVVSALEGKLKTYSFRQIV